MDVSLESSSLSYRWVLFGFTLVVALKLVVDRVLSVQRALAKVKNSPGCVVLWLNPSFTGIVLALGTTFPRPGMCGYYAGKFTLYKKFGATSFASAMISSARLTFWLAEPEAIAIVTSDRHTFQKNISEYKFLDMYGQSVASVEESDWKRHRRVAMSAFNEANIALVWTETLRVVNEWFEQLDAAGSDITVDMVPPMRKITLFVIATAGFSRQMSWTTPSIAEQPPGCKLTFRSAVMDAVDNIIFKALLPEWFYQLSSVINVPYLSSRALLSRVAFDDLRTHMLDLVASARAKSVSDERSGASSAALLRNLVEANMSQDEDSRQLTEGEVLANIFAFLLAGHDTSAHTLCFAFVLLALHPHCQQKLYEEVTRIIWPADAPLTQLTTNHRECMEKLVYTIAFIRETLRLFPPAPRISKEVQKDVTLPGAYFTPGSKESPSAEVGKFMMVIPAGSMVVMDIWALHMNPLHWGEDAGEFKPERFVDTPSHQWPRNAFLPFSGGARSCIGQQFALTEMVGIIASVVRRYQVRVPDDLVKKSFEEQKEALLKWGTGMTLTPLNARVKLCRRA